MPDKEVYLDVKGMLCPLPVLKARKRLKDLDVGTVLKVDSTDPVSVLDFPNYCNESGHELVDQTEQDSVYTFWIRKQ